MRLLIRLHRWLGGVLGLVLVALALSGTALLWEDAWIGLPGADDAPAIEPGELARAVEVARDHGQGLDRITFAGDTLGLHQAAYTDGSGAYIDGSGQIVDSWQSVWGRPELWLFDLHHYLLAGEAGEIAAGLAGLAGLFFTISGAIIWWRTRRTFTLRPWPRRFSRSAIIRHHRDLGIVAAPLLVLVFLTGAAMIFEPVRSALTVPFGGRPPAQHALAPRIAPGDVEELLAEAQAIYPAAQPRRLQFTAGGLVLRSRQPFEWTPNGRTYLRERDGQIAIDAPDGTFDKDAMSEKFYPVHAGKVGGTAWKLALTFAGMALALLGLFTTFSFWRNPRARPVHGNGRAPFGPRLIPPPIVKPDRISLGVNAKTAQHALLTILPH